MYILFYLIYCNCANISEFCKSVTEKKISKFSHAKVGEKVKHGNVRIIYFSLLNQNYILKFMSNY